MSFQKCKKIKERNDRARLREQIIFQRYYLKGEKLKDIAKELGMSLSGAEKVVLRLKIQKRKTIGEALDDPIVVYNDKKSYLFYTAKEIEKNGFKYNNVRHSLLNQTYTRLKNERFYVILAKDYKTQKFESKAFKKEIAKIKARYFFNNYKERAEDER